MQICLCWFPFSSFVWLEQKHVSLEGRVRTAIKAHSSGFYFAHLSRGFVSKTDLSWSNTVFPFCYSLRCVPLCTRWCWIKMSWACVGSPLVHTNINMCAQCVRVHACVFTCICLDAPMRICNWLMFRAQNLSLRMLARSLLQIAEYRFPACLQEGKGGGGGDGCGGWGLQRLQQICRLC